MSVGRLHPLRSSLGGLVSLDDNLGLLAEEFGAIGTRVAGETPESTGATRFRGPSDV